MKNKTCPFKDQNCSDICALFIKREKVEHCAIKEIASQISIINNKTSPIIKK